MLIVNEEFQILIGKHGRNRDIPMTHLCSGYALDCPIDTLALVAHVVDVHCSTYLKNKEANKKSTQARAIY